VPSRIGGQLLFTPSELEFLKSQRIARLAGDLLAVPLFATQLSPAAYRNKRNREQRSALVSF